MVLKIKKEICKMEINESMDMVLVTLHKKMTNAKKFTDGLSVGLLNNISLKKDGLMMQDLHRVTGYTYKTIYGSVKRLENLCLVEQNGETKTTYVLTKDGTKRAKLAKEFYGV